MTNIPCVTLALIVLGCFSFSPTVQAVSPPPDGGYPGENTAEGYQALYSLTIGQWNTTIGAYSLYYVTAGSFNTAVGGGSLGRNTANDNTAIGAAALFSNTIGHDNTADGFAALINNTTGGFNTATGETALYTNDAGNDNTADGAGTLWSNTTGDDNTASGSTALFTNSTGAFNTANGAGALFSNTTGNDNSADGFGALVNNTIGSGNTGLGEEAGQNITSGNNNVMVGYQSGSSVATVDNVICIGANVAGADIANSCYIGNIYAGDATGGLPVYVTSDGKLGAANPATASSARFKEEIKPMDKQSEALFALTPVMFRYKKQIDPKSRPQFGLVAEEVEKVSPDLIVRDKEGKPYSVRYDAVNAMLLNEFLKAHKTLLQEQRKVQEQEATVTQLKKAFESKFVQQQNQIDALMAMVKKQASQIQRVTLRLASGASPGSESVAGDLRGKTLTIANR